MNEDVTTVTPIRPLSTLEEPTTPALAAVPSAMPALASNVATAPPAPIVRSISRAAATAIGTPAQAKPQARSAARVDLVSSLRSTLGGVVPHAQYQIARLGALGVTGVAALLAAVVIGLSALIPGQNAVRALDADLIRAQQRSHLELTPEEGLGRLVATLPTRGQMPVVIGQILEQAQQAGVPLDSGHYAFTPAKTGSVGRYELEFPVKASYPQVRDFINRTLTAVPAAGLDKLHIERKTVADETVNADVRFVVFVRGE
ncbi:MAG: hypothetical protein JWN85_5157 [Gammaproteobacteria bacterium]|nr:hypothetical protein [Gammaproteobacteria bacterium]